MNKKYRTAVLLLYAVECKKMKDLKNKGFQLINEENNINKRSHKKADTKVSVFFIILKKKKQKE